MKQFYRVFLPLLLCVCCVLPGCAPQVNISSQPKTTSGKEQQSTSAVLPTRTPELLGSMKMATAFYKCSQAPSVIRVNIKEASDGMKAALRCLQGLAARTENASIYLSEIDYDQFWQDYTAADFGTVFKSVNAMDAFSRYQKMIKGLVIYDEKNEYEYPIAQTMASLLGYLPVTQAVQADLEDVLPKDLPVKSVAGKWSSAASAASYLIQELLPQCGRLYVGLVKQDSAVNDYLYATQSACVWLDVEQEEQLALFQELLKSNYQLPGMVFSDMPVSKSVYSPLGFGNLSLNGLSNLTFFSSIPSSPRNSPLPVGNNKYAEEGKIYLSLYIGDGGVSSAAASVMKDIVYDPVKGSTPLGLQFNPCFYELAPPIFNWHLQNRSASLQMISPSDGYMSVESSQLPETVFEAWMNINNYFLQKAGMSLYFSPTRMFADGNMKKYTSNPHVEAYVMENASFRDTGLAAVVDDRTFIQAVEIPDVEAFQEYTLTADPEIAKFFFVKLSPKDMEKDPYTALDNLVKRFQSANPGVVEFLLPSDLCATAHEYVVQMQTAQTAATGTQAVPS